MTRTLIDISQESIKELDTIASIMRTSRAELIRQAVKFWLQSNHLNSEKNAFGILKGKLQEDGVVYQNKIRGEW